MQWVRAAAGDWDALGCPPLRRVLQRIEARQRAQDKAQEALRQEVRAALRRERIALLNGVSILLRGDDAGGAEAVPLEAVSDSQV